MLKITILALGTKMPSWVNEGAQEYARRLADGIQCKLIEIPLMSRGKAQERARILEKEAALIKEALPQSAYRIALDVTGNSFSSEELAFKINKLQQITSHLCFLIGGPEGFLPEVLALCQERWSLSKLTLPHPLVRIVLLETLYRAWSIINHHPYHK
jgi:23S rRNA (pseudouridine1915-N3)-methyltransferase